MDPRDLHHALALTHWVIEALPPLLVSTKDNQSPSAMMSADWGRRWQAWLLWMDLPNLEIQEVSRLGPPLDQWGKQLEAWLKSPPTDWRHEPETLAFRNTIQAMITGSVTRDMRLVLALTTRLRAGVAKEGWTFTTGDMDFDWDVKIPATPSQGLPMLLSWSWPLIEPMYPAWAPLWLVCPDPSPLPLTNVVCSWRHLDSSFTIPTAEKVGQDWAEAILAKMREQGLKDGSSCLDLSDAYAYHLDYEDRGVFVRETVTARQGDRPFREHLTWLLGYDEQSVWEQADPKGDGLSRQMKVVVLDEPYPEGTSERERLGKWARLPIPMKPWPTSSALLSLKNEFPWAVAVIDRIALLEAWGKGLGQSRFWLPPLLLVGPAGCGKTRLAQRLGSVLNVPTFTVAAAGVLGGQVIQGTERQWSNTMPSPVLSFMHRHHVANPLIVVDEVDKAPAHSHLGSLQAALLPLLERESAQRFVDPCLGVSCDLSAVSWLLTANDVTPLIGPLISRLEVLKMPHPRVEHLSAIVEGVRQDLARLWDEPVDRLPPWREGDTTWVRKQLGEGGLFSARQAKRFIEQRLMHPGPALTVV